MMRIDDLPDSVLLEVFSYLPVRARIRISRVCHRWKRIAGDSRLWKYVDLTVYKMRPKVMWHLLRRYLAPHLQSLRLGGYLFTGEPSRQLSHSLIQALGRKCPKLWRLCLHVADLRYLSLHALPSTLRALELHNCEIAADWLETEPGQRLPPLESLLLQRIPAFSDELLQELGCLPSLRSLVLVRTYRLTECGLEEGLRELRGLQHFGLLYCTLSTDRVLGILAQHLTRLCSLRISIRDLSVVGLKYLSALPALERLTFVGPPLTADIPMPDELLAAFLAMPKLRTLEMLGVDWAGKEVLCKGLPHCKVVFSNYCPDNRDSWM